MNFHVVACLQADGVALHATSRPRSHSGQSATDGRHALPADDHGTESKNHEGEGDHQQVSPAVVLMKETTNYHQTQWWGLINNEEVMFCGRRTERSQAYTFQSLFVLHDGCLMAASFFMFLFVRAPKARW